MANQPTPGLREICVPENELSREQRGISAVRSFVYDPDNLTFSASMPMIGERFADPEYNGLDPFVVPSSNAGVGVTYENLRCRKIVRHPISNDKRHLRWDVYYSNEPTDLGQFNDQFNGSVSTDYGNLPIQMEHAGEVVVIKPTTNNPQIGWKWKDNNDSVNQPLGFKVCQNTLKVVIVLFDTNYPQYQDNCKRLLGKTNSTNIGNVFPAMSGEPGSWLFNSVSTEIYRDYSDVKKWQAEMLFTYRNPADTDDTDGWSKVLRTSDASWQIAIKKDTGLPLYEKGDFTVLFTSTAASGGGTIPATPNPNP